MYFTNRNYRGGKFEFAPKTLENYLASNFISSDYETLTDSGSSPTHFGGVDFGSIAVFQHEGVGICRGCRRVDHYRADHIDDFLVSLPLRGKIALMQGGSGVNVAPGNFIVCATAKPFVESTMADSSKHTYQSYQVRVSGAMLRAKLPRVDRYCHIPIKIAGGAGEIMASMFSLAIDEGHALSGTQSRNFGVMLIDSIANTMQEAPELSGLQPESRQSSYSRIRQEAEHFISCNMSNPTLNPTLIAGHCKVSVRYLYAAFASCHQTLGSLIRNMRLERCRSALRNEALRDYSIFEIALRWGVTDRAYFSRAYKAKFGVSPKDDRCFK